MYIFLKRSIGFAGAADMNYQNLLEYDAYLSGKPDVKHFIIEYNGVHNWFNSETFENAIIWMQLNRMKKNEATDTSYTAELKKNF